MKKYRVVVDTEMSLSAKIVDFLPKFNGVDCFENELDAYKFALMISNAIYAKNNSARVVVKAVNE